ACIDDRGAGRRRGRRSAFRGEAFETPLHGAEMVEARDDLLAGVAALVEGDAAEAVEVQHLRHVALRKRGADVGQSGSDLGERSAVRRARLELGGEPLERWGDTRDVQQLVALPEPQE